MRWLISVQVFLLATCCFAREADDADYAVDGGLLSVVADFDTYLDNLIQCRNKHFHCLKEDDKACEKSFGKCVGAYPMITNASMNSLIMHEDDQITFGIIPDKWKDAMKGLAGIIKDLAVAGKDKIVEIIAKGKGKIKDMIEKIKKIKMEDIVEAIKKIPEKIKKIPAKLKSLLEKIKAIPSIVYRSVNEAIGHCRNARTECIDRASSTAKKFLCHLKFPPCVPHYLSCKPWARAHVEKCAKHTDPCEKNEGFFESLICGIFVAPLIGFFQTIATSICSIPAYMLCGPFLP